MMLEEFDEDKKKLTVKIFDILCSSDIENKNNLYSTIVTEAIFYNFKPIEISEEIPENKRQQIIIRIKELQEYKNYITNNFALSNVLLKEEMKQAISQLLINEDINNKIIFYEDVAEKAMQNNFEIISKCIDITYKKKLFTIEALLNLHKNKIKKDIKYYLNHFICQLKIEKEENFQDKILEGIFKYEFTAIEMNDNISNNKKKQLIEKMKNLPEMKIFVKLTAEYEIAEIKVFLIQLLENENIDNENNYHEKLINSIIEDKSLIIIKNSDYISNKKKIILENKILQVEKFKHFFIDNPIVNFSNSTSFRILFLTIIFLVLFFLFGYYYIPLFCLIIIYYAISLILNGISEMVLCIRNAVRNEQPS